MRIADGESVIPFDPTRTQILRRRRGGVKIEIPESIWQSFVVIARALNTNGENLIASVLAHAIAPFENADGWADDDVTLKVPLDPNSGSKGGV